MTEFIRTSLRDRLAIFLSALCVVQCLLLPVVVTFLPVLDLWWLDDSVLHPLLLLMVVPLTFYTLIPAYRKHGDNLPLLLAIPGLILLVVGAMMASNFVEKSMTVVGAGLIAGAHLRNILMNRRFVETQKTSHA